LTYYGGIEAGGTKFICMVASGPGDILAETRFPTASPEETLTQAVKFFRQHTGSYALAGIGIASFGPLDLDPASPRYGKITSTPKPGWSGADIAGVIQRELELPVALDTDVNGAALAEYRWGAGQGKDPFVYITIGTGIGGGLIANEAPVHGLVHPEMGHVLLPVDKERDPFPGFCPFHGNCFEGLAAGPALEKRWGQPAETLPSDHRAWELEAHYISLALANLILTISPQHIVLGGGVMQNLDLFPLIHKEVARLLNGYVQSRTLLEEMGRYITPPGLGPRAGVFGAIALAMTL
jgi:fructokinase